MRSRVLIGMPGHHPLCGLFAWGHRWGELLDTLKEGDHGKRTHMPDAAAA
jgi:hypothetical protein